jgi:hypothetical protein
MGERIFSRVKIKVAVILIVISLVNHSGIQLDSNPIPAKSTTFSEPPTTEANPDPIYMPLGAIAGPICDHVNDSLAFIGQNIFFNLSRNNNAEVNLKTAANYTFMNKLSEDCNFTIFLPFVSSVTQFKIEIGEEGINYEFGTYILALYEFDYYKVPAIVFELSLTANEEKTVEVSFQRVIVGTVSVLVEASTDYQCHYLVSTTKFWGEPLEYANFVYWIHKDTNLEVSNIVLDGYSAINLISEDPEKFIVNDNNTDWLPSRNYKSLSWKYTSIGSNDSESPIGNLSFLMVPLVIILVINRLRNKKLE